MKFIVILLLLDVASAYHFKRIGRVFMNFGYLLSHVCFQHSSIVGIGGVSNERCFPSQLLPVPSVSVSTVSLTLKMFLFLDKITMLTSNEQDRYESDKVHWADRESQSKVWNRFMHIPKNDDSNSLFPKQISFRKKYKPRIEYVAVDEPLRIKPKNSTDNIFENNVNAIKSASNNNLDRTTTVGTTSSETPFEDPVTVGMKTLKTKMSGEDNSLNILKFISNAAVQFDDNGQVKEEKINLQVNNNLDKRTTDGTTSTQTIFEDPVTVGIKTLKSKITGEDTSLNILKFIANAAVQFNENGQVKKEKSHVEANKNFIQTTTEGTTSTQPHFEDPVTVGIKTLEIKILGEDNVQNANKQLNNIEKEQQKNYLILTSLLEEQNLDNKLKHNKNTVNLSHKSVLDIDPQLTKIYKNIFKLNKEDSILNNEPYLIKNKKTSLISNKDLFTNEGKLNNLTNNQSNFTLNSDNTTNIVNSPKSAENPLLSNNMSEDKSNNGWQKPEGNQNMGLNIDYDSENKTELDYDVSTVCVNLFNNTLYNISEDLGNKGSQNVQGSPNMTNGPKAADVLLPLRNESDVNNNAVEIMKNNTNSDNVTGILQGSSNMTKSPKADDVLLPLRNESDVNNNAVEIMKNNSNSDNVTGILQGISNMTNSPKAADVLFPSNNKSDVNPNAFETMKNDTEDSDYNVTGILQGSSNMTNDPKAAEMQFSCKNQTNDYRDLKSAETGKLGPTSNSNMKSGSTDKQKVNISMLVNDVNNDEEDDTGLLDISDHENLLHILERLDPISTEQIRAEDVNKHFYDEPEPVLKNLDREKVDDSMKAVLNNILGFKNANENIIWKENKAPYSMINMPRELAVDGNVELKDSEAFGNSKMSVNKPKSCVTLLYNNESNSLVGSQMSQNGRNSPKASEIQWSSNNRSVGQESLSQVARFEKVNTTTDQSINKDTSGIPVLHDSANKTGTVSNSKMIHFSTDPDSEDLLNVDTEILVKDFSNSDKKEDHVLDNLNNNNLLLQVLESIDPILQGHVKDEDSNKNANYVEPETEPVVKEKDFNIKDMLHNILGIKLTDTQLENKDLINLHTDEEKTFNKYDGR